MVVNGLITLRAYKKIDFFKIDFENNLEKGANVTFCNQMTNRWLGIRVDSVVLVFGMATATMAIVMKGVISADLLAFSL